MVNSFRKLIRSTNNSIKKQLSNAPNFFKQAVEVTAGSPGRRIKSKKRIVCFKVRK